MSIYRERIRVRPLLAVAAAVSLVGCGSTPTPGSAITATPATESPAPTATAANTTNAPAVEPGTAPPPEAPTTAATAPAKPLTLPNGSPACGNVAKRAPPCQP